MKTATLLITFLLMFNFSFGQELKIKYDINMKSNDPEMQAQLQMSEGSSLTIYAKDDKSRVEMNVGGLMKTTTVLDMTKNKGLSIMDGMLGKQAAIFEGDDFEKYNEEENGVEIEYFNETKKILGHTCKKAVIYMEEEDAEMILWYTEDLKVPDAYLGEHSKFKVPGMALEYSVEQVGITMKFVAVEFETSIKDPKTLFDLKIPAGYTEKSYKEISNMSGQ